MTERLIIAAFAVGSVGVHWLIYLWVKYKVDEGVITNLFKESQVDSALSTQQISTLCDIKVNRVLEVCRKNKELYPYLDRKDIWCLRKSTHLRA